MIQKEDAISESSDVDALDFKMQQAAEMEYRRDTEEEVLEALRIDKRLRGAA
jgi:hypothetical protein